MFKQHYALICTTALMLTLLNTGFVTAESFVLDFDSPTTGSNILDMPLESPLGTISASNAAGFSTFMGTGNALLYDDSASSELTMLSFDFDAQILEFIYTGEVFGVFTAIARNELGEVVDEFFNPDTSTQRIWGPITLQGRDPQRWSLAMHPAVRFWPPSTTSRLRRFRNRAPCWGAGWAWLVDLDHATSATSEFSTKVEKRCAAETCIISGRRQYPRATGWDFPQ